MAIYEFDMAISVTDLKHQCLAILRRVEETGAPVTITRRGKVVARLVPCQAPEAEDRRPPWERLRSLGGRLLATPEESVLAAEELEALG